MISQIRFKEKVNKSANITKNIKRLPLFSMDLNKFKKQPINPQSRDLDNLKINIRSSTQDQKIKQNNRIDNNTSQSSGHSSQTNIFIPSQLHQNNQNIFKQKTQSENDDIFQFIHKKSVQPRTTRIEGNKIYESKMLDENVINKPSFLTLENITNREKRSDKSQNQKDFTSLNYIFAEDTKHQKQNKERQKNKNIFIDMKKKIKKISKVYRNSYGQKGLEIKSFKSYENQYIEDKKAQLIKIHNQMLKKVYQDTEVIIDGCIFRNKIVPQRIDNDVDTDDEQINSGIRRLHKSLSQVALQYTSIMEKDNISSFDPEQNEQELWEQSK